MFLAYIFLALLRENVFTNALFSLFAFLVMVHLQRRALLSWRWYWIYAGKKRRNYLSNDMRQAIKKWQKANKQKNRRAWVIQRQLSKADCGCLMRRGYALSSVRLRKSLSFRENRHLQISTNSPRHYSNRYDAILHEFYAICLSLVQTTACPVNKAICYALACLPRAPYWYRRTRAENSNKNNSIFE